MNKRDWSIHPPYLHPDYKSTPLRAPSKPLIPLKHSLSELTGPKYGNDAMGKYDNDLTKTESEMASQSEIDEVIENADRGGKSSAMPHKNNPVLSEALVAFAKMNATLQSQQLLSLVHANERDASMDP